MTILTFANSLDPDQAPQNVGPESWSKLFETDDFPDFFFKLIKINLQTTKNMQNSPACKELTGSSYPSVLDSFLLFLSKHAFHFTVSLSSLKLIINHFFSLLGCLSQRSYNILLAQLWKNQHQTQIMRWWPFTWSFLHATSVQNFRTSTLPACDFSFASFVISDKGY